MWQVDPLLDALAKSIDVAALRHSVHAANIANADVPEYQRLEVRFEAETAAVADLEVMAAHQPEVVASADSTVRLDQEVAQMSGNAVRYQALLGAFERTLGLMRYAAREGREG